MARVSTTKAYDNKDVIIQINNLKKSIETKQDTLEFDGIPTNGSSNPVTSAGIKNTLDQKVSVTDFTAHTSDVSNPHSVTKTQLGLGNCDNTRDIDKPISTAVQNALNGKQTTTPGTNESGKYLKVGATGVIEYETPSAGVTLSNEIPSDLGTASAGTSTAASRSDHTHTLPSLAQLGAQATLKFDTEPTLNSSNPVTSGGVKTALNDKQATLTFDTTPTNRSSNPVTSDGVYTHAQNLYNLRAPIDHANTSAKYGSGTNILYGHTKTVDDYDSPIHVNGKSMSPYAGHLLINSYGFEHNYGNNSGNDRTRMRLTYGIATGNPSSDVTVRISGYATTESMVIVAVPFESRSVGTDLKVYDDGSMSTTSFKMRFPGGCSKVMWICIGVAD